MYETVIVVEVEYCGEVALEVGATRSRIVTESGVAGTASLLPALSTAIV